MEYGFGKVRLSLGSKTDLVGFDGSLGSVGGKFVRQDG